MQNYLISDKITVKEAKTLFKIRTNMLEVRNNYKTKNKYSSQNDNDDDKDNGNKDYDDDILCPLCKKHLDSEENILKCEELGTNTIKFDDLFSKDENKMAIAIKEFQKLWKKRQIKLLK